MSNLCHICGPVKHEAPTVICAPCALAKSQTLDPVRYSIAPAGVAYGFSDGMGGIAPRTTLRRCDGDHGAPRCLDPECWIGDG